MILLLNIIDPCIIQSTVWNRAATIRLQTCRCDFRFLLFDFRFNAQYCSDSHFKQISVDAYQLCQREQRIYATTFKTRNFIGWQGLRKPISATDSRRLKKLTWRTHISLCLRNQENKLVLDLKLLILTGWK